MALSAPALTFYHSCRINTDCLFLAHFAAMLQKIFLVLLLFCFSALYTFGAKFQSGISIAHFSIAGGLSNNSVNVVFQDSRGFIWIGTEDGLNRYDGYEFQIYRSGTDFGPALVGNRISALAEDRHGNLWIGTKDQGLTVLNPATGTSRNFKHLQGDSGGIPGNQVLGLYLSPQGVLWVKFETHLSRYLEEEDAFESFVHYSNVFKHEMVVGKAVLQESDTTLLVGTRDGLSRFSCGEEVFRRLQGETADSLFFQDAVAAVVPWKQQQFLLGSRSGLYVYQEGAGLKPLRAYMALGSKVAVNALCVGGADEVWVGTSRGLERLVPDRNQHQLVDDQVTGGEPLLPYEVSALFEDASGLLWVGTRYKGLFKINTRPTRFSFVGEEDAGAWNLRTYNITAIHADRRGHVWLGTLTSGLYRLDPASGQVQQYLLNEQAYRNHNDQVGAVFEEENGRLWVGSNTGIYYKEPWEQRFSEFDYGHSVRFRNLLRNSLVSAIEKDGMGSLWFGTRFGLYRYWDGQLQSFFSDPMGQQLPADEISALCTDGQGDLWIGTNHGMAHYDSRTGHLRSLLQYGDSLPLELQVLDLAFDGRDRVWAGTRKGLFALAYSEQDSLVITKIAPLANDMVTAVLPLNEHQLWFSSGKGLSVYGADGVVHNYDGADGLPSDLFNVGSAAQALDGTLYFGAVSGLVWGHPDSLHINMHRPPVAVTGVSVCHRGDCRELAHFALEGIKVKYRPGMLFNVKYAALEFTQPHKNSYQIMLQGYDKDWRPVSRENSVSFSNLMPGQYTLRIRAANNDFTWNTHIQEWSFEVTPPLWMTNYAYAFYFLLLIFFIQMLVNYRLRHYRRANRSLAEQTEDQRKVDEQRKSLSRVHQNLTDSIHYATRIQAAMLPTEERLHEYLKSCFVYFRPRDMVSGDFYWLFKQDGKLVVAAVDCTGHGVPGAFMSIIGMDLLKSIVAVQKIYAPAKILEQMSMELDATLRENSGMAYAEGIKDGMDVSLCVIDQSARTLDFAGAVNGMYLVRNNELQTIKGDRLSIGRHPEGGTPAYNATRLELQDEDFIYLFSDGYADQFGGPEHKKFKYRRFRHLLLNIHALAPEDQKAILHQKFEEWRGAEEQVDDVLVMGFKPL